MATGETIQEWFDLIREALAAKDATDVDALVDRMDGWPTIIDVEEYVEDEEIQAQFSAEVKQLEDQEASAQDSGNEDLAFSLHLLIGMLTAT